MSHDRAFVDAVGTDLIFWDHRGFSLSYYHGTLAEHAERAAEQALGFERQVTTLEKDKVKLAESIEVLSAFSYPPKYSVLTPTQRMKKAAAGKTGDQKKSDQAKYPLRSAALTSLGFRPLPLSTPSLPSYVFNTPTSHAL